MLDGVLRNIPGASRKKNSLHMYLTMWFVGWWKSDVYRYALKVLSLNLAQTIEILMWINLEKGAKSEDVWQTNLCKNTFCDKVVKCQSFDLTCWCTLDDGCDCHIKGTQQTVNGKNIEMIQPEDHWSILWQTKRKSSNWEISVQHGVSYASCYVSCKHGHGWSLVQTFFRVSDKSWTLT